MRNISLLLVAVFALAHFACPLTLNADQAVKWENQAVILAEYDDNVYKVVNDIAGDFLARIFFDSKLTLPTKYDGNVTMGYTLGAKVFAQETAQDTLINQFLLRAVNRSWATSYLGGDGRVKFRNIRDGDEDYNKLNLNAFAGHYFAQGVSGEAQVGYTRFDFKTYDFYDYWMQHFGFQVKKAFSRDFRFGVYYTFEDKHFPFNAYENVATTGGNVFLKETGERRNDTLQEIGVFFTGTRYVLCNFRYSLQINNSNSYGDGYYNHRLRLTLSKSLTEKTNAHLLAIANFRDSYEEVLIPRSFSIEEDDENYNQVLVKLNRQLSDNVWLETRYGRLWSQYSVRRFKFNKNTYSLGLSINF
jgi:hypothetical protein